MFALDSLLAVALLTAAPGSPDPASLQKLFPSVHEPLQALAVRWEILDPREVKYILARSEDFAADLNLLRRRYLELANAPALADCTRLPDRTAVNELLAFN